MLKGKNFGNLTLDQTKILYLMDFVFQSGMDHDRFARNFSLDIYLHRFTDLCHLLPM